MCDASERRDKETDSVKHSALKWLYAVPGKKKWYIVFLTLVQALHGASGVFYAMLLRGAVDAATAGDRVTLLRYVVYIVALVAVQIALSAVIRWLNELTRAKLENVFKARLLNTLLKRDYLSVNTVHSGEWMNRLTNDTVVVANSYTDILPGLFGMVVKLISALAMVFVIEPRFAVVLVPSGLLLMAFTLLFRKVMKRLHKNVQEQDGRLRIFLQERIASLLLLRSYAAEAQTDAEAEEKMHSHCTARMKRNRFSNLCNIGFGTAMNGMYLLCVGWCGYGILNGTVSFGTLTAVMQLISQIQAPFANITGYLPRYYSMIASAERLMEAEQFTNDDAPAATQTEMRRFYRDELKSFGLEDVSFTYYPISDRAEMPDKMDMPVVLHGLNLEIQKGEYVAFTGASGCGKSTALKLLMCVLRPDDGRRYFIDTNGVHDELDNTYRRLFAYVPQGNMLMNGTIREVIAFADLSGAQDEARIRHALRVACADTFVEELEQGVDTLLGERGTGLSEGQMQRIAIARAIFADSPILLLDEATSALDADTERRLLENLRSMTDKTVVIVTHRPAALGICDRVIEFTENGQIAR